MRICKKCGKEYDNDMQFCTSCGNALEEVYEKTSNEKRVCSGCGKEYQEAVKFCNDCGKPVEVVKEIPMVLKNICSSCGAEYEEKVKFCNECGNPVEEREVPCELPIEKDEQIKEPMVEENPAIIKQTELPKNSKKGPLVAMIIVAVCVFVLALLVVFDVIPLGKKNDDSKTVVETTESKKTTTEKKATTEKKTTEAEVDVEETTEATTEKASSGDMPVLPDENGEAIYVYSWNGELGDKIDSHFRARYPEYSDSVVYINLGMSGDSDEYRNAIQNSFSGSEVPSVVAYDAEVVDRFSATDVFVPIYETGITENMYANAYAYTKNAVTFNGELMAMTWQATPGCFIYNADIAIDVFGTDDPNAIQEYVKDWDTFVQTAELVKEKGYYMLAGTGDMTVGVGDQPDDETINAMASHVAGYMPWDDNWSQYPDNVFGYFGCPWFVNWSMGSVVSEGRKVCAGPRNYYWGGTYLGVTKECPNMKLATLLLYTLCCDDGTMYDIGTVDMDYPNNSAVVQMMYENGEGCLDLLDGQSPLLFYDEVAKKVE